MHKKTKQILALLLSVILLLSIPIGSFAADTKETEEFALLPIETTAKAVLLGDADSGKILTGSHIHDKLYPASVTKIMTLLLTMEALESGKIKSSDVVTASRVAAGKGGSQIWLKEGETMTVHELLKATAVASANDASTALGEYIAGSESAFIDKMNDKAKALGMKDTHFENCTGLDDDVKNHQTSAYDVFLMSRALLSHPKILEYTTIWMDSLRGGKTSLVNTNKLIHSYDGATGLKTGTTSRAGCCVSASAKRADTHLIAVVLGSPNSKERFETAKDLLNWGFSNFETVTLSVDAHKLVPVEVLKGQKTEIIPTLPSPQKVILPKGQKEKIQTGIELALNVEAPVEEGQMLGKVIFSLEEKPILTLPLLSKEKIPRLSFREAFRRILCVLCG